MISNLKTVSESKEILTINCTEDNQSSSQIKADKKSSDEDDSINFKKQSVKKTLIYRVIGAKIAYYRTLRQLSQSELANKINISTSTLGRIERGKYNSGVPISTLLDIAEGLRIELSALVTFSKEEKKFGGKLTKI